MKIVLIGASGFVGTRLLELLRENDEYELKNIDLQQSPFFPELTVIGDVRDQKCLDKELSGADCVILLAAQHRDDVSPETLYYDTNVGGMEVTLRAMEKNKVKRIIFYSSVAVYGLNKQNPDEEHPADPFNHYGKSKWQAECVLREWGKKYPDCNINILRPTVIFGERNRGNVYNLLRQIAGGKFWMVGKGNNKKSMAYVGNIAAFTRYMICHLKLGYNVFNYVDKPDYSMNELIGYISFVLKKYIPATHIPYWLGMLGGYGFDLLAFVSQKKMIVSSVRVKKFCATTQFDASKVGALDFIPPFTLSEGLARTLEFEFVHSRIDDIIFKTE